MDNPSPLADPLQDLPADLRQVARRYATYPVPTPSPAETARLVTFLLAADPTLRSVPASSATVITTLVASVRWRLQLLGPWFWIVSVALFALATSLTPQLGTPHGLSPLVLLAPLTIMLSLVHALRTTSVGLRWVEQACPMGFLPTSASVALALAVFDAFLGVGASLGLALLHWAPFGLLVLTWLGPLLLCAAISLPIALRWGTMPAALIGGGPWLALALWAEWHPASVVVGLFALPQTTSSVLWHLGSAVIGLGFLGCLVVIGIRSPGWVFTRENVAQAS